MGLYATMSPKLVIRLATGHLILTIITMPADFKAISSIKRLDYKEVVHFTRIQAIGDYQSRYFNFRHTSTIYATWTLYGIPILALKLLPFSNNVLRSSISPREKFCCWKMSHYANCLVYEANDQSSKPN